MKFNFRNTIQSKYVYVSLIGGFGNNLFQVSLAKKIESIGYNVKFDISIKKTAHLELYKIPELQDYVQHRVAKWTRYFPSPIGPRSSLSRFFIRNILGLQPYIDLTSNGVEPKDFSKGYFLSGYWQNIDNAAFFGNLVFFERPLNENLISVHVRRGDMVSNIEVPLDGYYKRAVLKILAEHPDEKFQVNVFTDDLSYCSQNLDLGCDFEIIQGGSTLEDFIGMISSEYLVISRSTFSWWAGYFSSGFIYYPVPWSLDQQFSNIDVIPPNWVGVPS